VLLAPALGRVPLARENVYVVENGTYLIQDAIGLALHEPSGKISYLELPKSVSIHEKRDSGFIFSWEAFGVSLSQVTATYAVPAHPIVASTQVVTLFTSLESADGSSFFQTMLTYQSGSWTLTSFLQIGSYSIASIPYTVNVGDSIIGQVILQSGTWLVNGYVNGVLRTSIGVGAGTGGLTPQTRAQAIALQVSNVNECQHYPATGSATAYSVAVYDNGVQQPNPTWYQIGPEPNMCVTGGGGYVSSSSQVTIAWLL